MDRAVTDEPVTDRPATDRPVPDQADGRPGARPPAGAPAIELEALAELLPFLRRAVALEPRTVTRLRQTDSVLSGFVQLPFAVLVGRSIRLPLPAAGLDLTVGAEDLLTWVAQQNPTGVDDPVLDEALGSGSPAGDSSSVKPRGRTISRDAFPARRDADWRGTLPPLTGWQRVDVVPESVLRGLVAAGLRALADAAAREGLPNAEPRAEVTDALLDSTVLTVSAEKQPTIEVSLRTVSAAVRMGFLPVGSSAGFDVSGRWSRLCAPFGNVYAERGAFGLGQLS